MVIGKVGGRVLAAAGALCLAGWLATASAGEVPGDAKGYTDYAAKVFKGALPGAEVTVSGPLSLRVRSPGGSDLQVDLNTVYRGCQLDPTGCASATAHRAQAMIGNSDSVAIDPAALRAVVRTRDYVEALASPGDHMAAAPLVGDLWVICVVDGPDAIAYVGMRDLNKLGLSEQQLIALARRNTSKALGPLSRAHREHSHDLWLITGDPYESSRLLEPKRWASLARRLGGLAVAVPAPDIIVYGDDKPETVLDLMATANNIAAHVRRPLSTTVYRWSSDGWQFELGVK